MCIKKQKTIGVIVKVFESEGMISQVHVITFKIEMHFLTTNSKINNQTHENCNEVQNADYELEQQRVLKKKRKDEDGETFDVCKVVSGI